MRICLIAIALTLTTAPALCFGQDRILLQEILPALDGTELGLLEVGDAPPPGRVRTVRRSEVLRALRQAERPARGLSIPRATRVRRDARTLDRATLGELASPALAQALGPCRIDEITTPREVTVASGPMDIRAEATAPRRDGSIGAVLIVEAGGRETRIPVRASVRCPPPAISVGSRVRIQVVVGNVRASVTGEARQPGRVGDLIRVTNGSTRSTVRARVVNARTVELVQ